MAFGNGKPPLSDRLAAAFRPRPSDSLGAYVRRMYDAASGEPETGAAALGEVEDPALWLTGTELIGRIVRAIELGQSVLLTGARGCGKTHCIRGAIDEAMRLGFVSPSAVRSLQGNREIPRDYLMEDEVVFRTRASGSTLDVIPAKRSAPLLAFVERDPVWNEPLIREESAELREAQCEQVFSDELRHPVKRFVLFLDEINRFTDGVLDGLLSVMEERVAFVAGQEYRLPVVVLMTMNPPGYDATARRLSPPLAARIGRCYTLSNPDIDTLTDEIMRRKLCDLEETLAEERIPMPEVSPVLRRKVALATLCLWGDPEPEAPDKPRKAGMEYLTPETRALLRTTWEGSPELRPFARWLTANCRFGPDGRAPADWITAAIALARHRAAAGGADAARLTEKDLLETVIESVSHKIYDEFSAAVEPAKQARKEQAIREICKGVLTNNLFRIPPGVVRTIDSEDFLVHFDELIDPKVRSVPLVKNQVYLAFVSSGVTENDWVAAWIEVLGEFRSWLRHQVGNPPHEAADNLFLFLTKDREVRGGKTHTILTPIELGIKAGFSRQEHEDLARALRKLRGPLALALDGILRERVGVPRPPLRELMLLSPLSATLTNGPDALKPICDHSNVNKSIEMIMAFLRLGESLWNTYVPDDDALGDAVAAFVGDVDAAGRDFNLSFRGALKQLIELWKVQEAAPAHDHQERFAKFRDAVSERLGDGL